MFLTVPDGSKKSKGIEVKYFKLKTPKKKEIVHDLNISLVDFST